MQKLCIAGIATIVGLASPIALPTFTSPARAEIVVPEDDYNFGTCTIDTGEEAQNFSCYVLPGRAQGVFFIRIFAADEHWNFNEDNQIGVFIEFLNSEPHQYLFQWGDGTEESIRGSSFDGEGKWIFWIERGWAISFEAQGYDLYY